MTGAHCEMDRRKNNQGTEADKYFFIRGTPEQVEHAKRVFSEKLGGMVKTLNYFYQTLPDTFQKSDFP